MSRKFSLMTVLAAASLGLGLAGCELNEECDPATDPECRPADTGGDQADQGGDVSPDVQQFQTYNYILIEDRDRNASGDRPGADIDAVELRSGGTSYYLSQIHESGFGGEQPSGSNRNFQNATGAPQGQCIGQSPANWDATTFVSLGGAGGYLIGSFQGTREIATGDQITVHACSGPQSEDWDLSVGVARTLNDDHWVMIIDGGVSVVQVTVPNLPQVPRN
jgi:hypothetical protein